MNNQGQINLDWLSEQGYTLRQAAKAIGRSHVHVYYVLTGKRLSCFTEQRLRALPKRPYMPYRRERVDAR